LRWFLIQLTTREAFPNNAKSAFRDKKSIGIDGKNRFFQPTEKNMLLYFGDIFILPFESTAGGHKVRPVGYLSAFAKYNPIANLNWL
jgi:hypothetical protein